MPRIKGARIPRPDISEHGTSKQLRSARSKSPTSLSAIRPHTQFCRPFSIGPHQTTPLPLPRVAPCGFRFCAGGLGGARTFAPDGFFPPPECFFIVFGTGLRPGLFIWQEPSRYGVDR